MAYIANSDISQDMLAAQFTSSYSTYHTAIDNHINELAEGEQIEITEIAVDIDGYLENKFLRRYATYWVRAELFLNKMGVNNNTLAEEEKYNVKYEIYIKKVNEMQGRITKEMLINEIESRINTSYSGQVYRG